MSQPQDLPEPRSLRATTGPLPRHLPRRALLCSSTPPQFVEMLRLARYLKATGSWEAVIWVQMLPHKLQDAIAICEAEGFPYIPVPMGTPAPPPPPPRPTRAPPPPRTFDHIPFVREAWADARRSPWEVRLWAPVARALLARARLRVWRNVMYFWGQILLGRAHFTGGPPVTRRITARAWIVARAAGGALANATRALTRLLGRPWTGLPSFLRPFALPLCAALFFAFDGGRFVELVGLFRAYRRQLKNADRHLKRLRPDIVIAAEDSLYEYAAFLTMGARRGIPAVIVPYTISTAAEPADTILNGTDLEQNYTLATWPARLVARLFPRWLYTYKGRVLLRLPPTLILVLEYLRMAAPHPWMFNSGDSVALAAESPHMAELYRREGLSADYVKLTGALYDDVAAAIESRLEEARREILGELGLPVRARVVVCALPPRMELDRRPECDLRSHDEIVETLLRPLTELPDTSVLVSLHPTLRREDLLYVEAWGARLSTRNVAELVSCADVFVASISATIRIAIGSGIPVLNYDVFRYGYRDYDAAPGVVTMVEKSRYLEAVARLRHDPAYEPSLAAAQREVAPRWGFRDGRSGETLLALLEHVIAHHTGAGFLPPARDALAGRLARVVAEPVAAAAEPVAAAER